MLDGERVLDAFGMQLLSPGHDLTGVDLAGWELTHHQPEAWFPPGPWRPRAQFPAITTDTYPTPTCAPAPAPAPVRTSPRCSSPAPRSTASATTCNPATRV